MSLKQQAVSGILWTFTQQFGIQAINFVISIVLARLLLPSDFGTIALLGILIDISNTLINSGMASSLIRIKETDDIDYSTVFLFNIITSAVLYFILFCTAPLIADFYRIPVLASIIRVFGITLIINAFTTVQQTLLTKAMAFKVQLQIEVPSLLLSGLIGLVLAYYGFGVWTLVYMAVIQSTVQSIQTWLYAKWRPYLIFDKSKFKRHFSFGYKMTLSGLLNTIFNSIYPVTIGKVFSSTQLGYYNRADNLKQLPVSNLSYALNKVTYPLFAKIQDDDDQLRLVYRKLMKSVIFVISPVLVCMAILATPLIRLLFTEKWLSVVPYFQILSIAGILYPIHSYNLNILEVKGRSDLFLHLELIKKFIIIVCVLISIRFGIYGLLWTQVATSIFAFFVNTHYTGKYLNYNSFQQLKDIFPAIALSACTGIVYLLFDHYVIINCKDIVRLLLVGSLYIATYALVGKLLHFKEFHFLKNILLKK